jgi:hypothetical protein
VPLFFPRISAKVEREDKIRKLGGNIDEKHNLLQPPEIVENLFIRLIRKNEELCVCIIFIEQKRERGEIERDRNSRFSLRFLFVDRRMPTHIAPQFPPHPLE